MRKLGRKKERIRARERERVRERAREEREKENKRETKINNDQYNKISTIIRGKRKRLLTAKSKISIVVRDYTINTCNKYQRIITCTSTVTYRYKSSNRIVIFAEN